MSRIGILGSQGVGKTTLLNALRSEEVFKGYYIGNEVTREIANIVPINENGTTQTQDLIMYKHAYNLLHDNLLTDRTAIDCYLYTQFLYLNNPSSGITLAFVEKQRQDMLKMIAYFDFLVYIRPEFTIEDDGVRSVNPVFVDNMVKAFEHFVYPQETNDLNFDILERTRLITVTGSVRNRVQQVLKMMKCIG